jgi:hypothetical protein
VWFVSHLLRTSKLAIDLCLEVLGISERLLIHAKTLSPADRADDAGKHTGCLVEGVCLNVKVDRALGVKQRLATLAVLVKI